MSDTSPYRKFLNVLFLPILLVIVIGSSLMAEGLTWYTFIMFGLLCASCTLIFNDWLLEQEIQKYREAIDNGLIMFEGSVWAKTYWKLGTPKARLQREIRRRERAGA